MAAAGTGVADGIGGGSGEGTGEGIGLGRSAKSITIQRPRLHGSAESIFTTFIGKNT